MKVDAQGTKERADALRLQISDAARWASIAAFDGRLDLARAHERRMKRLRRELAALNEGKK
jgi:hypothetical protein